MVPFNAIGWALVLLLSYQGVNGQDCATTYSDGTTFNGNDLLPPTKANATACLATCEADVACYAMVYTTDGTCSLKSIHYLDEPTTINSTTFMSADVSCLRGMMTMGTIDMQAVSAQVTVQYTPGSPPKYFTIRAIWSTAKPRGAPSTVGGFYSDAKGASLGSPQILPADARTDILGPNGSPTNTTALTVRNVDSSGTSVTAFLETDTNGTQVFYATVSPPLPAPPPPPAPLSPPPPPVVSPSDPPAMPVDAPVLPPPPPPTSSSIRSTGVTVLTVTCLVCLLGLLHGGI